MARHRARGRIGAVRFALVALISAGVLVGGVLVVVSGVRGDAGAITQVSADCPNTLRVVAADSFAPALTAVAPKLATGPNCVVLDVEVNDGRAALGIAADPAVDVWIPDDAAWTGLPGPAPAATDPALHAGETVAISPLYLVTDRTTGGRLRAGGNSWRALADMLDAQQANLVLRDPAGSGDGLLAIGAVGESVWLDGGMDASTIAVADVVGQARVITGSGPALPRTFSEVGALPEHALLSAMRFGDLAGVDIVAPTDHTAALRYTWRPNEAAAADPTRAVALNRLWEVLTGPGSADALAAAGLRAPGVGTAPGDHAGDLPPVEAPLFDVLGPHHVDHVFATWYPADRTADVLVVVDVSGSMGAVPPGTGRPLIDLTRDAVAGLTELLPAESRMELWEFGVGLNPPDDHRVVVPRSGLVGEQREAVGRALAGMVPQKTGSGLHDTVLAAYAAGRDAHRAGVPNRVIVLTDGRDEADPGSPSLRQLADRLAGLQDPARPVELSVVTFGDPANADRLQRTLEPLGVYVDHVEGADQVRAMYLHAAAGGLHG